MTTQHVIQPSFGRGELSPRLHARVDIDHWRIGLAECFNFIVMRQGGLRRRPGTQFVALTKDQNQAANVVRIIEFVFSVTQSYVLELGHLYMRVHGLGGTVVSGGVPYEVVTPWLAADVPRLHFKQSGDVIYVVHRGYPPHKITRFGETNWTIAPVEFEDGPYLEIERGAHPLYVNGTGNIVPLMTGPTTPSGVASASSVSTGYPASQAFDRNATTDWMASGPGYQILQYEFATAKVVSGYSIKASQTVVEFSETVGTTTTVYKIPGSLRAPRTWTVSGSNDGITYTTLDTRSGEAGWGDGERRYYTFANEDGYTRFRLEIDTNNAPERPVSIAEWSMQGSGVDTQSIGIEASSTVGINRGAGFKASDVGRHIRLLSEDIYWHWGVITTVTSPTVIVIAVKSPPLPTTKRIKSWRLGAFSPTTGYPQALTFFSDRLVYGGTAERPQTIYGTRTGTFEDFGTSVPLKPDDGFSFTFGSVGEIVWLEESGDLVVGTTTAIRTLGPADKDEGFSATNVSQGKPARSGSSTVQPVQAGQSPLFVGRFGDALREAAYSFDAQGYLAPDVSVLSEHMLAAGVRSVSYALDPNAMVWCGIADGALVGVTYEKEQQMTAMHRHGLGGGGIVESQCVIPGANRAELWLVARRTRPNGTTMRTIERMAADFTGEDGSGAVYLDCSLSYSGAATTAITGLAHLNGFEVGVLANGATQARATVSAGVLTVPDGQPASTIHVGFPYESRAKTLPISQGLGDGSGLGRRKRVKKVILSLLQTGQVKAKATSRSYQDLILRSAAEMMDVTPPLFTGDKETHVDDQWGGRGVVTILCDDALPATVRAVTLAFDAEP